MSHSGLKGTLMEISYIFRVTSLEAGRGRLCGLSQGGRQGHEAEKSGGEELHCCNLSCCWTEEWLDLIRIFWTGIKLAICTFENISLQHHQWTFQVSPRMPRPRLASRWAPRTIEAAISLLPQLSTHSEQILMLVSESYQSHLSCLSRLMDQIRLDRADIG